MFQWLRNLLKPARPGDGRPARGSWLRARYDAAQTTEENAKHWGNADGYSANGSNTPGIRRTLRNRARYETENNSYAKGLVATLAHDLIGSGPRLQLNLPGDVEGVAARLIERRFARWATSIGLADKLRLMHESRVRDGESFAALTTNPALDRFGVQLDLRVIEADQIETPYLDPYDPLQTDGIRFDTAGNPVEYHILRRHPGETRGAVQWGLYDRLPAASMLHWFRPSRAGQARGIPEITPALPLFAQLRRYTLAVISAAELAAMIAGVMKTDTPADADNEPVSVEAMDRVELERGALLTLPAGWEASQFNATQPVNTYEAFKGEVLNEIGRCVQAPFNVVAGNSSRYNYSSGRLDHLIYHRTIWIERDRMQQRILDHIFRAWLNEAILVPGILPAGLAPFSEWDWAWHWDGFDSIDPQKDAATDQIRLASGTATLAEIYSARGLDWAEQLKQRAKEIALASALGVPTGTVPTPASDPAPAPEDAANVSA